MALGGFLVLSALMSLGSSMDILSCFCSCFSSYAYNRGRVRDNYLYQRGRVRDN